MGHRSFRNSLCIFAILLLINLSACKPQKPGRVTHRRHVKVLKEVHLQSDDPQSLLFHQNQNASGCPPEFLNGCAQGCRLKNGQPTCECFEGFMSKGADCVDINECEDSKVKEICSLGCVNTIGSYFCTSPDKDLKSSPTGQAKEDDDENYEYGDEDEDYDDEDYYTEQKETRGEDENQVIKLDEEKARGKTKKIIFVDEDPANTTVVVPEIHNSISVSTSGKEEDIEDDEEKYDEGDEISNSISPIGIGGGLGEDKKVLGSGTLSATIHKKEEVDSTMFVSSDNKGKENSRQGQEKEEDNIPVSSEDEGKDNYGRKHQEEDHSEYEEEELEENAKGVASTTLPSKIEGSSESANGKSEGKEIPDEGDEYDEDSDEYYDEDDVPGDKGNKLDEDLQHNTTYSKESKGVTVYEEADKELTQIEGKSNGGRDEEGGLNTTTSRVEESPLTESPIEIPKVTPTAMSLPEDEYSEEYDGENEVSNEIEKTNGKSIVETTTTAAGVLTSSIRINSNDERDYKVVPIEEATTTPLPEKHEYDEGEEEYDEYNETTTKESENSNESKTEMTTYHPYSSTISAQHIKEKESDWAALNKTYLVTAAPEEEHNEVHYSNANQFPEEVEKTAEIPTAPSTHSPKVPESQDVLAKERGDEYDEEYDEDYDEEEYDEENAKETESTAGGVTTEKVGVYVDSESETMSPTASILTSSISTTITSAEDPNHPMKKHTSSSPLEDFSTQTASTSTTTEFTAARTTTTLATTYPTINITEPFIIEPTSTSPTESYPTTEALSTPSTSTAAKPQVTTTDADLDLGPTIEYFKPTAKEDDRSSDENYDYDDEDYDGEDYKEGENNFTNVLEPNMNKSHHCENGFKPDDSGVCVDVDECRNGENVCSHGCENTIGSYRCTCPQGFEILLLDPYSCRDINECLSSPCSHRCVNEVGSFYCECPEGYTLEDNSTNCTKIPCSHHYETLHGIIQCQCPFGLVLGNDDVTCEDVDECKDAHMNNCSQICVDTVGSYSCACNTGFYLAEDGHRCVDVDECRGDHGCSHGCQNINGTFRCTCEKGFQLLEDNKTCVDIDECSEFHTNDCDQVCNNNQGGYSCSCHPGYRLHEDEITCRDIGECDDRFNGNCSQICSNLKGSYRCNCNDGFVLSAADNRTCVPSDPCLADNGGCSHVCVNLNGRVECECPEGFMRELKKCVKVNACAINNGGCSHLCEYIAEEDRVNCLCPELHVLHNRTHCVEVNPCSLSNGGCSHVCTFRNHSIQCSCPKTHDLHNATHCFLRNPCSINNGNCSHFCSFENNQLSCSCPEGYDIEGKKCYKIDPCLINNGGCSHECYSNEDGKIECSCPLGHYLEGKNCILADLCAISNGNCSHICKSFKNKPVCSCPRGFHLENSTHCEQDDPCSVENGGCSDICESIQGVAKCSCPEGYVLKHEVICTLVDACSNSNGECSHICSTVNGIAKCSCPDHFNLINSTTCEQVNPCFINNGGCSHECTVENDEVVCICPEGYEREGKKCLLTNPCEYKNGGCSHICEAVNGQVVCRCPPHYDLVGKACFKINPCLVNNGDCSHICTNYQGVATCSCPHGYTLDEKECVKLDPCTIQNGGCSHMCTDQQGVAICSCPPGYTLDEKQCVTLDPCTIHNGGCSHICNSHRGVVTCSCPPGYLLDEKRCMRHDPCTMQNGGCSHICNNHRGVVTCSCPPGYILDGKRCIRQDPCTIQNGGCSHICIYKDGIGECSCPAGYILRPNKKVCKEVNECKINRGGCSHGCRNLPGSYMCTCPKGFALKAGSNKTCADVNECLLDNGNCQAHCENFVGGYRCSCEPGYELQEDKHRCKPVQVVARPVLKRCSEPVAPRGGVIRCSNLGNVGDQTVPPGTRCLVWCNEGSKLVGNATRVCEPSGSWSSFEPYCSASTCPKLGPIKNGWFIPGNCNNNLVYSGEKCQLQCRRGYKPRHGFDVAICNRNLQWQPREFMYSERDLCIKDSPRASLIPPNPFIICPGSGHLNFVLPPSQPYMRVDIPKPETNVDWHSSVRSLPSWGTQLFATLSVGRREISFIVFDPRTQQNLSSCQLVIDVLDKEVPRVFNCPSNIETTLRPGETSQQVKWEEPRFEDNIAVTTVYKSRHTGTYFGPGLHHVNYVASDEAGNRAFCHFTVNVKNYEVGESAAYMNRDGRAERYRAVLICPSGIQYMSKPPDTYNNAITSETGCYWRHIKVTKPIQAQAFRIPPHKIHNESKLPPQFRVKHRYFEWYDRHTAK